MVQQQKILRGLAATLVVCLLLIQADPAVAQDLTLSLSEDGSLTARSVQLLILLTVLSLVPALAIMFTCFPFMVTVLAILRQGIGLQQSPPNMLIVSLALFLTYFVMEPVFLTAWQNGINPLLEGDLSAEEAASETMAPFRVFMMSRVQSDTMSVLAALRPETAGVSVEAAPLSLLVPSFLLSEIERAFQIGFLIFLPFLDHRSGRRRNSHVHGHDDGAASDRFPALQAGVFRCRGWVEFDQRCLGPQLFLEKAGRRRVRPSNPGRPFATGCPIFDRRIFGSDLLNLLCNRPYSLDLINQRHRLGQQSPSSVIAQGISSW